MGATLTVFAPASLFFGFPRGKAAVPDRPDQCPREYKNANRAFRILSLSSSFQSSSEMRVTRNLCRCMAIRFSDSEKLPAGFAGIRSQSKNQTPQCRGAKRKTKASPADNVCGGCHQSVFYWSKAFFRSTACAAQGKATRSGEKDSAKEPRLPMQCSIRSAAFSVCGAGSADRSHFCRKPYQLRTTCVIRYFFHVS